MKFSLIIPCFNEEKNIPLLLDRCISIADRSDVEIILVNNGSTDKSKEVFEELLPSFPGCQLLNLEVNQGYGGGILAGLNVAEGEILGWTHADMQTDPMDMLVGVKLFEEFGSDNFVKGRRYGRPFTDKIFTAGMSVFETMILLKPMWDINAQPTMFSRSFYDSWVSAPTDFSLDLYAYYAARERKLKIRRFPVEFSNRVHGVSSWNVNWPAKWKFIRSTIEFSFQLKKALKEWK